MRHPKEDLMSVIQRRMYARCSIKLALGMALALVPMMSSCGGDQPSAPLQWYATCGDPVCRGYTAPAGVSRCTTETPGAACVTAGTRCDPMDSCNALYVCATSDPKTAPGGCPISRQKYKTDIRYLDEAGLQKYADELSKVKLATYRYKTGGPTRLGFIIEDHEPSVSIDSEHDMVDLYGYTSMTVAALKLQEKQLAALQQQVRELSAQLKAVKTKRK